MESFGEDIEKLTELSFDVILLDEIQHVKNTATITHRAAASLRAKVKIGLTGTPVENSLDDLHGLFSLCLPDILEVRKNLTGSIAYRLQSKKVSRQKNVCAGLLRPFILRRTRSQVLKELPATIEDSLLCSLTEEQKELYHGVLESEFGRS